MQELLEQLHRSENRIIALYRTMDGGEEFVRLFQSTPTATTTPAEAQATPNALKRCAGARCSSIAEYIAQTIRIIFLSVRDPNNAAS
jgi:hypothetical protein